MADYTMDDEKWNNRVSMIESHMASHDMGDMAPVIEYNLSKGTTDVANRKRYWANLTNLFATVDNSPIRIGKQSSLPQAVQDSLEQICVEYAAGHSALFATHPLFGEVLRARGKAGYTPYTDGESYGKAVAKNLKSTLTTQYNNYVKGNEDEVRWDGTVDKNGVPNREYPLLEDEG